MASLGWLGAAEGARSGRVGEVAGRGWLSSSVSTGMGARAEGWSRCGGCHGCAWAASASRLSASARIRSALLARRACTSAAVDRGPSGR